ncbi:quinone-dependent dihydroorotate dehydrogenase [Rhodobacteraceae bacterium RKSG542]|uniref:quinone-dependent dihydroorotate dehydrogenase n=1 Tax=Pseudovibrio flavus TaxID=2529854 RepID=UPI0012BC5061|nr:quinone-dependent dihydroorotate dehydrogenase [Pseudovibrio flavus]MTI18796.1 quinone-dependent dihydroorotate dehydrogenase [Pseudovibrio flavus]
MSLSRLASKVGLKALHRLDAEQAHNATISLMKKGLVKGCSPKADPRLAYQLGDLSFANPLGMAAGFDKNAEVPAPLFKLGFGFVEVGTVTPKPQVGNEKPRNFRLAADKAVINRYGFNNDGHDIVHARLKMLKQRQGVLGINIGANKTAEDRTADYVLGVHRFAELADYLTVNISSPNTPGLRDLQAKAPLLDLAKRVLEARDEQAQKIGRSVPVFLKIAPDNSEEQLEDIVSVVKESGIDAMIVSNTTITRPDTLIEKAIAKQAGGLSGAPLFRLSTVTLAKVRKLAGPELPIIGVGGINSGPTAWAKITAGANLLQLYSSLVFEGAPLIADILEYLSKQVEAEGLGSLQEAVGKDVDVWANEELV